MNIPMVNSGKLCGKLVCRNPLGLLCCVGNPGIAVCTGAEKLPANTSLELFVTSSQSISALKCKNITARKPYSDIEWKHISLTALVSSLLSFWTKARAGDRQDATECADRELSPSGVPEAPDSSCSEWK